MGAPKSQGRLLHVFPPQQASLFGSLNHCLPLQPAVSSTAIGRRAASSEVWVVPLDLQELSLGAFVTCCNPGLAGGQGR